jgi:hypothetical protein
MSQVPIRLETPQLLLRTFQDSDISAFLADDGQQAEMLAKAMGYFFSWKSLNCWASCDETRSNTVRLRLFDENFRSQRFDNLSQRRDKSPSLQ